MVFIWVLGVCLETCSRVGCYHLGLSEPLNPRSRRGQRVATWLPVFRPAMGSDCSGPASPLLLREVRAPAKPAAAPCQEGAAPFGAPFGAPKSFWTEFRADISHFGPIEVSLGGSPGSAPPRDSGHLNVVKTTRLLRVMTISFFYKLTANELALARGTVSNWLVTPFPLLCAACQDSQLLGN